MKLKFLMPLFFLLISISTFAQKKEVKIRVPSESNLLLERQIRLKDHNQKETITVEVENDIYKINFNVQTRLVGGKMKIDIYNPDGEREGTFSVSTQLSETVSEVAMGQLNKEIFEPQPGIWKIVIDPKKANAEISLSTSAEY